MYRLGAFQASRCVALVVGLLLGLATLIAAAPARAASPFTRAFTDDIWFTGGVQGPTWVPRTSATGARRVLLEIDWAGVEGSPPPPGVDPTNPSGPEYSFGFVDARVREFARSGMDVALLITNAPRWAEAPGGPASLMAQGAWRPNATAFGQMATALGRRYSGSYPDPLAPGSRLPRVRFYQAWAEANFSIHLAPQWVQSGGSWVPASPGIYRNLLNNFYAGIKRAHSDNVVITEGSGPYGDVPGPCASQSSGAGCRMPPAMFARELMCLHGHALALAPCANPPYFDAQAMDPYEVNGPTTHAFAADDVSAPDLGKLTRVANRAVRTGRALPRGHKQLWVTEFGYDSSPPNPQGVPAATQARWLEQAFYLFWKQGVNTAVWYLVRDQAGTNYATSYFSGVYFQNARRKPSFVAYRFPLVVMRSGRRATVWGISPRGGQVSVQRRAGRSWRTMFRSSPGAGNVFVRSIPAGRHGAYRAVVGPETSLTWNY